MNEPLRQELIAMRAQDLRVREELIQSGEMDGTRYVPRMEAVHRKNAARLRQIIAEYGWPDTDLVGQDGTLAAWFIAQHAIGEPTPEARAEYDAWVKGEEEWMRKVGVAVISPRP